ncbi:MAG: DoxX family membrane protein [Acidobacteria bacterium]|nr:DoxX family membrane protein [Acidobacteriota bacterium]
MEEIRVPAVGRVVSRAAQQPALALFALGLVGMGLLALVYGDFAMGWQPVAPWFPARTLLAYGSGVLMVVCGAGLFFEKTTAWSLRIVLPYLVVWQMLKFPALVVAPKIEGVYLGFGELAVLLAGGWTLFARLAKVEGTSFAWAGSERAVRVARYYFAVWIIPIGLSHMLYLTPTLDLIPSWLPGKVFWAYLTGIGQIASGLGVLFGVLPRVAAFAESVQIFLYTLLIWLPAILMANHNLGPSFAHANRRLSFTAFLISWIIAAGAWAVAQNVPRKEKMSAGGRRS